MRYFKAAEKEQKPFITWNLWAENEQELELLEDKNSPLILQEKDIPKYIYGICPLKIMEGNLVNRTQEELAQLEAEFNAINDARTKQIKRDVLQKLYLEITLSTDLAEDTTELSSEYNRLKQEYLNYYAPKDIS